MPSSASIRGVLLMAAASALAQPAPGPGDFAGEWELTTVLFGHPPAERLNLEV